METTEYVMASSDILYFMTETGLKSIKASGIQPITTEITASHIEELNQYLMSMGHKMTTD